MFNASPVAAYATMPAGALSPEDREARFDADPHGELRQAPLVDQLLAVGTHVIRDAEAGKDRTLRVVLVCDRSAEDAHGAVTCEVRDHAPE